MGKNKKLQLNKETIAKLNNMDVIKGGAVQTDACPTYFAETCNNCYASNSCPSAVTCESVCYPCPPNPTDTSCYCTPETIYELWTCRLCP